MKIIEQSTDLSVKKSAGTNGLATDLQPGSGATFPVTQVNSLMPPRGRHPYYIVTPRYVRTSAGIRCMHLLCHWLNRIGQSAYVLIDPFWDGLEINPELTTPVLNQFVVDAHFEAGICPIVFCAETYDGSEFDTALKVRFLGNYPGHLGGPSLFQSDELIFGYSQHLARLSGHPDNVLHIPSVNAQIFYPDPSVERSGSCFYAAKYQDVHGGKVFGLPEDCFEIVRDRPDQLTQEQMADLFRRSEVLYVFEDSSIANEAAMCGCPVVLMPNEHFSRPLAIEEVGWDGYAWGTDEDEVQRARSTIGKVYENYQKNFAAFFEQLDRFVAKTQDRAKQLDYTKKIFFKTSPIAAMDVVRSPSDDQATIATLRAQLDEARLALAEAGTGGGGSIMWLPTLGEGGLGSRVVFVNGWNAVSGGMALGEVDGLIRVLPLSGAAWVQIEVIVKGEGRSYSVHASKVREPVLIAGPTGEAVTIDVPVLLDPGALDIRFSIQAQHGIPSVNPDQGGILIRRITSIPSSNSDRNKTDSVRPHPPGAASSQGEAQIIEYELEDQGERIDDCVRVIKLRNAILEKLTKAEDKFKSNPRNLLDFTASWTTSSVDTTKRSKASDSLRFRISENRESLIEYVLASDLFDADYYRSIYLDAAHLNDHEAMVHFVFEGMALGRNPHPLFSTLWYVKHHDGSEALAPEPFIDFLMRHGKASSHPLFDGMYYAEHNPDVINAGLNCLTHYMKYGAAEMRSPHPAFDPHCYISSRGRDNMISSNPLIDYIVDEKAFEVAPCVLFDPAYYRANLPHVVVGTNPLVHYLEAGHLEAINPHCLFHTAWYLNANPDISSSHSHPFLHFLRWGCHEHRSTHPLFDNDYYRMQLKPEDLECNYITHYLTVGIGQGLVPHSRIPVASFKEIFPHFVVGRDEYIATLLSGSIKDVDVRRRPVAMRISEVVP